jgi:hypothetical protein
MLRAAQFDGSVTPSHWRRSNWLLHVCCAVLVFSDRGSGRPLLFLRWMHLCRGTRYSL